MSIPVNLGDVVGEVKEKGEGKGEQEEEQEVMWRVLSQRPNELHVWHPFICSSRPSEALESAYPPSSPYIPSSYLLFFLNLSIIFLLSLHLFSSLPSYRYFGYCK